MSDPSRDHRMYNAEARPHVDLDPITLATLSGGWFVNLVPGDLSRDLATQVAAHLSAYLAAEAADGPDC